MTSVMSKAGTCLSYRLHKVDGEQCSWYNIAVQEGRRQPWLRTRSGTWPIQRTWATIRPDVSGRIINAYKSASSRIIKKEFPEIRKSLWKEMFWSQSFCLLTAGGATADIIKQYIESQGGKDGKQGN